LTVNRANGMDDPLGGQIAARRYDHLTGRQSIRMG